MNNKTIHEKIKRQLANPDFDNWTEADFDIIYKLATEPTRRKKRSNLSDELSDFDFKQDIRKLLMQFILHLAKRSINPKKVDELREKMEKCIY
jgi:hypothetical protein